MLLLPAAASFLPGQLALVLLVPEVPRRFLASVPLVGQPSESPRPPSLPFRLLVHSDWLSPWPSPWPLARHDTFPQRRYVTWLLFGTFPQLVIVVRQARHNHSQALPALVIVVLAPLSPVQGVLAHASRSPPAVASQVLLVLLPHVWLAVWQVRLLLVVCRAFLEVP